MKNRIAFFALILCILMTSCNWFQNLVDTSIKNITQNECGILVFKDSTHFLLVYNILEKQLEDYENSPAIQNNTDEEKPLTDFEILKSHSSYRKSILDQEQTAENNGVDLSINPINEILEDDVILQTLLNKDRFLIIDNTGYYYYDDCTLYKFPIGMECQRTMPIAINFFEKLQTNPLEKAPFVYEKIDICNDEENYASLKNGDPCQTIKLVVCPRIGVCNPEAVNFIIIFPQINNSIYTHINPTSTSCNYTVSSPLLNPTTSLLAFNTYQNPISSNFCSLSSGEYGYVAQYNFLPYSSPSSNNIYHIKIEAEFSYPENGQIKTCTQVFETDYTMPPPCPINYNVSIGSTVIVTANNPCGTQQGSYTFTPLTPSGFASPSIISTTPNSIELEYPCSGEKELQIDYNYNGCQNSIIIKFDVIKSGFCCYPSSQRNLINNNNYRINCTTPYYLQNNLYKLRVTLKERKSKLSVVVRSFKKNNQNKYKKYRTDIEYDIWGSVYYGLNPCYCSHKWDIPSGFYTKHNKSKLRTRYKFSQDRGAIENLPSVPNFNWFKKNWSRLEGDEWKFTFRTSEFPSPGILPNTTIVIDCKSTNCALK